MTTPSDSDWAKAAVHIWGADEEGDVWLPVNDPSFAVGFSQDTLGQSDYEGGAWVTGARVWISREQLDAYLALQAGKGEGPHLPIISYEPPSYFN
jgi:hypothetical protein